MGFDRDRDRDRDGDRGLRFCGDNYRWIKIHQFKN